MFWNYWNIFFYFLCALSPFQDLILMFLFLEADFFARLSHPTCCDFCYHHDYKVCIENYPSIFNSFKCVENLENPEHMKGPLQIPWAKCHNWVDNWTQVRQNLTKTFPSHKAGRKNILEDKMALIRPPMMIVPVICPIPPIFPSQASPPSNPIV